MKTYAVLKYHGDHSTQDDIAAVMRKLGAIPVRYHSTAIVAARAAFRTGLDEQAESLLERLERRFPESADAAKLRAEFHAYHNRYGEALTAARHARLLDPPAAGSAAQTVKYGYHALDHDAADRNAVEMVRRFPVANSVLWAAAKACISGAQFDQLYRAWREGIAGRDEREALLLSVRQLATAAARGHRVEEGIALFRRAITQLHEGDAAPVHNSTKLAGRGAWNAIADIRQLLDDAGVPFFFAAGTALGFERVGRPLSDDGDIDVGIRAEDFDPERLTALVAAHPRFVVDPHPLSKKVHMRHRGGCPVDFFRYYDEGEYVWHDGVFVRWWNTPFKIERREFQGLSIPLPSNPDLYLTENYADWRTPNPEFDSFTEEAPNCTVHWPEYHRLHFMRRAFKAMIAHDRRSAAGDLRRAEQSDLADLIGRNR
ncbi:tetratricopeptide repeat protein [Stackebrandtia nassauensis]|uniref:tetratricopeptide repeat protein n=1 Tax=Stackebrandtia nassauensis TaxID=283811 RepID=UPI001186E59D|nr:hypothetical protein [Stackebrandtia nassauensis]